MFWGRKISSNWKKQLVENDCNGLIEFIESTRTLNDFQGQDKDKAWLRQEIKVWQASDIAAMPKGYLLCGPVGTGKTYMVECLAGEAGVPVVKLKNFRDKWVGSTEGNLERIFRLLQALGRCWQLAKSPYHSVRPWNLPLLSDGRVSFPASARLVG